MEFSREALGKASGLPPARAFYALEVMLCAVGKEAGLGTTLLVDCGVGVLAARGRVVKFTFVQVCRRRLKAFIRRFQATIATAVYFQLLFLCHGIALSRPTCRVLMLRCLGAIVPVLADMIIQGWA